MSTPKIRPSDYPFASTPTATPTVAEAIEYARNLPADCHADRCIIVPATELARLRAEVELAEWSVLKLWGGTPEIIHEFIKGQQNRIHHCQDLEAEFLEQARLLGMSGEREADLLGKIERLAKDKARLDWLEDHGWITGEPCDRAAIDAAMKP